MRLLNDSRYRVIINKSNVLAPGSYYLLFRGIFVDDNGIPFYSFSENLKYDSKYFNLFPNSSEFLIRLIY